MLSGSVVAIGLSVFVGSTPLVEALVYGAISGIFVSIGLATLYRGMAKFSAAVVAPPAAVCAAIVPFVWDLIQGAQPSGTAMIGCGVAIVFLGLSTITAEVRADVEAPEIGLSVEDWIDIGETNGDGDSTQDPADGEIDTSDHRRSWRSAINPYGLVLGIGAGILLGLGIICIAGTPSESGAWSVAGQRVIGFATMAGLAAKQRVPVLLPSNIRHLGMLSGLAGTAGITCLVLGVQRGGDLGLVAVAGSMFPAVAVLIATVFDGDKIRWWQVLGIAGSIGGVSLIALGS